MKEDQRTEVEEKEKTGRKKSSFVFVAQKKTKDMKTNDQRGH